MNPESDWLRQQQPPQPEHPARHHAPPAGLRAWLASVDLADESHVHEVELDGVWCVVKRRRASVRGAISYGVRYLRAFALGVGCKIFLGEFPNPGVLLRNGLAYEAERLRFLGAAGCRVPQVWWQEPGLLVLEHVGTDLSALIRHGSEATRVSLMQQAGRDLAEFHLRGLWHGGAQIRNITVRDGEMWRIDFEENIGGALSLPLAQAYDLFQLLASLVSLRSLPAGGAPLGRVTLDAYFQVNPDEQVRARLARLGRATNLVARPVRPLLGRLSSRDIQGFFRLAEILRHVTAGPTQQ
jgi:tRNA A-37 threonylcarbamoyl transferase component Bud32